jgi:2-polyprenyl-3-methyl-5-hydroxy-6-metoxy-1,4-benzoquinol methylase
MTQSETNARLAPETGGSLPLHVLERGKREKDFYNNYSDPSLISDEILVVPKDFGKLDLPMEIAAISPSLSGKTVCDYGCGCGLTSAFFALSGATTHAFDVSDRNVSIATRTARVNGVAERVFLKVAQGEGPGYPSDAFDLIFGKAVLHHLDIPLAARELYRTLKPGGAAVFYEPLAENRMLEWVRNSPLRSSNHRHTADERNILYSDLDTLRSCFDRISYREAGLLSIVKTLCRKVEVGMVAVPRGGRFLRTIEKGDRWILGRVPSLRPIAHYIVILMFKQGNASEIGQCLSQIARELRHSTVKEQR